MRDYKVTGVQTCALPICLMAGDSPVAVQAAAALARIAPDRPEVRTALTAHLSDPSSIGSAVTMLHQLVREPKRQIGRASCRERAQRAAGVDATTGRQSRR